MPLLDRETEIHPPDLFAGAEVPSRWWVAYVRSRQEKSLARHLLEYRVAYYLPNWEKRRRSKGRTLVSFLPLFPGYVFFRGLREERRRALESNLIVKVLEVKDQFRLEQELSCLWQLQSTGVPLYPHPYLGPGNEVRIIEGAFKGWTGRVLREKGRARLIVSVNFLRQSVAAEFDREALAPMLLMGNRKRVAAASG